MRHQPLAEERALALVGAVDELVDQHEGARRQFLLERAAGRQRHQIGDAGALQDVDIGPVVDVGGRQPVALFVARQEHHRQAGDLADAQRRRRLAPRAGDALLAHLFQPGQVVDAGPADDAEDGFGHVHLSSCSARARTHKSKSVSRGWSTSALPSKADICQRSWHVPFGPKADTFIRSPRRRVKRFIVQRDCQPPRHAMSSRSAAPAPPGAATPPPVPPQRGRVWRASARLPWHGRSVAPSRPTP